MWHERDRTRLRGRLHWRPRRVPRGCVCVWGGGGVPEETGGGGVEDGGWVGEVDVQGRVRPCVMKDTELEKI